MSAQTAADLRAAAEVLRRDGLAKGRYYDCVTGSHCIFGALANALSNGACHQPEVLFRTDLGAWERVNTAAEFVENEVGDAPDDWNDAPGRTADEVIAALEAAADAAEVTS